MGASLHGHGKLASDKWCTTLCRLPENCSVANNIHSIPGSAGNDRSPRRRTKRTWKPITQSIFIACMNALNGTMCIHGDHLQHRENQSHSCSKMRIWYPAYLDELVLSESSSNLAGIIQSGNSVHQIGPSLSIVSDRIALFEHIILSNISPDVVLSQQDRSVVLIP